MRGRRSKGFATHKGGRTHNGLNRLEIASATAEITRESIADLSLRRRRIALEKGIGREEHTGRAEATLDSAELHKGLLQRVKIERRAQALDGRDGTATSLGGEHHTSGTRNAIDKDRAGATLASFTALLDTRMALAAQERL
jgi:hypothetical protein